MLTAQALDRLYRNVPAAARDELLRFRAAHPIRRLTVAGTAWEYLAGGRGRETLLILPGLLGLGEMSFQHILRFERDYRVIAPSYPFTASSTAEMTDGIAGLLEAEGVRQAHVLGGSYGGMVAQALVRRHPGRVGRLVLSHTGGPKPERAAQNQRLVSLLRLLPLGLLRAMLRAATRKSLAAAPEHIPFWVAYSDEMIARLGKADLVARYDLAVDFDRRCRFAPDDLRDWPGRILILEGDDDPIAEAPARAALKALHPQARIHTFHGTGHVASIARLDEYVSVITAFLREA